MAEFWAVSPWAISRPFGLPDQIDHWKTFRHSLTVASGQDPWASSGVCRRVAWKCPTPWEVVPWVKVPSFPTHQPCEYSWSS